MKNFVVLSLLTLIFSLALLSCSNNSAQKLTTEQKAVLNTFEEKNIIEQCVDSPQTFDTVYMSFSNSWDDSVLVVSEDRILFNAHITTIPSIAITNRGCHLIKGKKKSQDVIIYVITRQEYFHLNIDFRYRIVRLYSYEGYRVKYGNSSVMIF